MCYSGVVESLNYRVFGMRSIGVVRTSQMWEKVEETTVEV